MLGRSPDADSPLPLAAEHTRDELALVGVFVARAIARDQPPGLEQDLRPRLDGHQQHCSRRAVMRFQRFGDSCTAKP